MRAEAGIGAGAYTAAAVCAFLYTEERQEDAYGVRADGDDLVA
jgi:hypothetical protein